MTELDFKPLSLYECCHLIDYILFLQEQRVQLIRLIQYLNIVMGKKGVLLDNGKVAQSSMALYWKAGQKKGGRTAQKAEIQQKQEDIQSRAGSGMERWKQHKQKMISKLYTKPQKKDAEAATKELQQKQRKMQEEMERQLIQKQMNKHKPISIPGFKGTSQLQKKRQYEKVTVGNQDNNKLILPQGFGDLTQEDIVQMLREKKAKKELQRNKNNIEKAKRVQLQVQNDFLANRSVPKKLKEQTEIKEKMIEEKAEEKSFFKSQILQKIEKGQSIASKKEEVKEQAPVAESVKQQAKPNFTPKFIPRSLWNK